MKYEILSANNLRLAVEMARPNEQVMQHSLFYVRDMMQEHLHSALPKDPQ
jgi:hypothetical protein